MNKRKKWLTSILIVVFLSPFVLAKIYMFILESRVTNFLVDSQGYTISDIKEVKGEFGKLPLFGVWVIFEDEPFIQYFYNIEYPYVQLSYAISKEGERMNINRHDINEDDLKHRKITPWRRKE